MDQIEKVIYINLSHRQDRKIQIERQLSVFPQYKVMRFDAIYEKDRGHLGCSKSHIAVLEMAIANNWKNCLVVEDDMIWNNFETGTKLLGELSQRNPDVIVLGGGAIKYNITTYKLNKCTCTTAYLVFNHYYQTLLSNFKEGADLLEKNYDQHVHNAIDQYWHTLQKRDSWFIVYPVLCLQRGGYSDINKQSVAIKLGDLEDADQPIHTDITQSKPNDADISQSKPNDTLVFKIKSNLFGGLKSSSFRRSLDNVTLTDNIVKDESSKRTPLKLHNWTASRF
jgi:glycosyl transferase family 25